MNDVLTWALGNQGPSAAFLIGGTGLLAICVTMAVFGIAMAAGWVWP